MEPQPAMTSQYAAGISSVFVVMHAGRNSVLKVTKPRNSIKAMSFFFSKYL